MPRTSGGKGSRIAAEERRLEEQRTELVRLEQKLRKKLQELPVAIEAQEQQRRDLAKHRAEAAGPAISSSGGRAGRRRGKGRGRGLRTPSHERYVAKLWTMGLVIILLFIGFMLWRVIPSS